MRRSTFLTRFALLAATTLLAGCGTFNQLGNSVSSFSQWPADRKPGSFSFERLPSQAADAEAQQRLEDAARGALATAGFTPAADPAAAEFSVLLGARVNANDPMYWDDPFWWRGGMLHARGGYWRGPFFGPFPPTPTYEREVALLIRDRKSGLVLYETRAANDGGSPSINALLPAMYEAALKDFPAPGPNPRRVVTTIGRAAP